MSIILGNKHKFNKDYFSDIDQTFVRVEFYPKNKTCWAYLHALQPEGKKPFTFILSLLSNDLSLPNSHPYPTNTYIIYKHDNKNDTATYIHRKKTLKIDSLENRLRAYSPDFYDQFTGDKLLKITKEKRYGE